MFRDGSANVKPQFREVARQLRDGCATVARNYLYSLGVFVLVTGCGFAGLISNVHFFLKCTCFASGFPKIGLIFPGFGLKPTIFLSCDFFLNYLRQKGLKLHV